jgi:hypothetical protein
MYGRVRCYLNELQAARNEGFIPNRFNKPVAIPYAQVQKVGVV